MDNTVYEAIRNWVHESPLSICTMGSDSCDDHKLAEALTDVVAQAGTPLEGIAVERAADAAKYNFDVLKARGEVRT